MTESKKRNGLGTPLKVGLGLGILAVLLAALFLYWYFFMRGIVSTKDARLDGDLVDVAPEISGTLDKVLASEGERVQKGQLLFTMKGDLFQAAVIEAKAALNLAKANLGVANSKYKMALTGPRSEEIMAAEATERKLRSEMEYSSGVLERARSLFRQEAISKDKFEEAENSYKKTFEDHEEASQHLKLLREGTRSEELSEASSTVEAAQARVAEASALLQKAELSMDRAAVTAPFSGLVVRKWLDSGATVSPGKPVLTVFNPSTLHVSANIEEKNLDKIKIGDPVTILVDAYPSVKLEGRLEKILMATNSQFSLIPAEGVSGTFIKVSQRVPIRISIKDTKGLQLGPGLSATVRIRIGKAVNTAGQKNGS